MGKRTIIQICVSPESDQTYSALYALCNDGTVWIKSRGDQVWIKIKEIPQD